MLKQLLGNPVAQFLIGRAIGYYMLLVIATTRWRKVNLEGVERIWAGRKGVIIAIWHGRFMLVRAMWRVDANTQPAKFLISASREGGVVTHTSRTVGADVIRGSAAKGRQSKGGFEAMREMKRHLDTGGCIGMTPDGPRGPRMRVKMGPIQLAKLSGVPIVPLAWSTRWRKQMGSWDRFIFPLPFGSGVKVWGEPIYVPRDADNEQTEAVRLAVENEMLRVADEADRLAGVAPTEPAPLSAPRLTEAAATTT